MNSPAFINSMNYTPMFGQMQPQQHGSAFNPFGDSELGRLVSQIVNSEIAKRLGGGGFMSAFNPSQNFFDQYQAQQFSTAQSIAMKTGMARDSARLQDAMKNMYSMVTGKEVTPGQAGLISGMTDFAMQNFFPTMASRMPGTIDQMFGIRGSASLFNMGLVQGMRGAMGPGGQFGGFATKDNAAALAEAGNKMFEDLTRRPTDLHGLGGASAGQMFAQMTQRGLIGEKDLITAQGKFNTEGTKAKLKEMSNAVAAMRDVFGDMGKADAPMVEIMNGLEALTQGGLGKLDGARVARIVRETHHVAKMAGVGMDAVMGMQSSVTAQLSSLGLDSSFANPIVQESMGFATAYGSQFGGAGGWRKANKEQMIALDQKLRVGATNSQVFNQGAAILRMGELGLLDKDKNSEAYKLYEQLKSGNGDKLRHMSSGDFIELLKKGGVDANTASNALMNPEANAEFGQKYNLSNTVRMQQARIELTPRLNQVFGAAARTALGDNAAADKIASVLSKDIFSKLDKETLADPVKRQQAIVKMMVDAVGQDKANQLGMDKLGGLAATVWGNLETTYGKDYGGATNFITAHSPEAMKRQQSLMQQARRDASLAGVMSGFGVSGPFRRLFEAMSERDEKGQLKKIDTKKLAQEFFGADPKAAELLANEETRNKVVKAVELERKITDINSQLNALDPNDEKTKAKRAELEKQLDAETGSLSKLMYGDGKNDKGLSDTFRQLGLNSATMTRIREKSMSDAIKDIRGKEGFEEKAEGINKIRDDIEKRVREENKDKKLTDAQMAEKIKEAEQDWLKNEDSAEYKKAEEILGKKGIKELKDKNISLSDFNEHMKKAADSDKAQTMKIVGELNITQPGKGNVQAKGIPEIPGNGAKTTETGRT